jgi:hypothetical protein
MADIRCRAYAGATTFEEPGMTDEPTTTTDIDAPAGPLRLPLGRTREEGRVAMRLGSYLTSPRWLPAGWWPELDEAREEHRRLCSRLAEQLDQVKRLGRVHKAEDVNYAARLKAAARTAQAAPEDDRTPPAEREHQVNAALDQMWSLAAALADVCDETIALIAAREPDWINDLGQRRLEAEHARREADRLLQEARIAEWGVHQVASWVLATSEGRESFRGQPVPPPQPPPDQFERAILSRPWWREQDMRLRRAS